MEQLLIKYFPKDISTLILSYTYDLYNNCKNGNYETVKIIKQKNWDDGLLGACRGGHIDIIKLMIEKGANNWNWGLFGACRGGHIDIVKLMIEKGVNNWNLGLFGACCGGHIDIIKLMIEKGANYC